MTLGSLFDGSGGFPLAAKISGITPIWASEIEPFPIRVTTKRIPEMKHYGDVRKMDGSKVEPVDIISFGSPCQDLSVAGKHNGLEGSRSSLFHEAVRIIKEMRKATDGKYPRYAVWENVPGVLTSNGGEDFRVILESICAIKRPISISRPRWWTLSGEIVGQEFSVAWRTFNAQFWGVPQRRRRVFLIADFGADSAGKILFERKDVPVHVEEAAQAWKRYTARIGRRAGTAGESSIISAYGIGKEDDPSIKKEVQPSITSSGAGMVYDGRTAVRRLTPLECCRLQGFPDWWCDDLGIENPSESEMDFWIGVFGAIGKNKTKAQLRKWLKNPRSDAAEYKMWGNGVALPCVTFILWRIINANRL